MRPATVLSFVATALVVLPGLSGGAIAQRYALRYPEHIDKLILVASIRINNGMNNRFIWRWFGPALYFVALGLPPADANAWFTASANSDSAGRLFDRSKASQLQDTGTLSFIPWRDISLCAFGSDYASELHQLAVPRRAGTIRTRDAGVSGGTLTPTR